MAFLIISACCVTIAPLNALGQPLDTAPEPPKSQHLPRTQAREMLPLDTGTISVDTVHSSPAAAPPDDDQVFSLFHYRKIVEIGPDLSWFYYNEHVDINPIIRQFRDIYLYQPGIEGTPKSSEYGAVLGIHLDVARYLPKPHLFTRSHFGVLLGLANTYDGSLQGTLDTSKGSGTILFAPQSGQKNNFFIFAGVDFGPAFANVKCPWAAYTGLDLKIWYRDMIFYSQQEGSASASELYFWFSVPLGMVITKPVSPHLLLGCEPRIDFMFYGKMQASESGGVDGSIDFPALKLGNRASLRLDAFMQTRLGPSVSLRFGPYAMLYGFAQSNTDTVSLGGSGTRMEFVEPASASLWIGINFQVSFLRERLLGETDK